MYKLAEHLPTVNFILNILAFGFLMTLTSFIFHLKKVNEARQINLIKHLDKILDLYEQKAQDADPSKAGAKDIMRKRFREVH